MLCMIFVVTPSGITSTIDMQPMLCQSHATPMIYRPPLQVVQQKTRTRQSHITTVQTQHHKIPILCMLCTQLQTTIRHLTYFTAVSHHEEVTTQHLLVTCKQCRWWFDSKLLPDGPLIYTNHVWKTQNHPKAFWPSIFPMLQVVHIQSQQFHYIWRKCNQRSFS